MMGNHTNLEAVTQELLSKKLIPVGRRFKQGAICYERTLDGLSALVPYFVVDFENRMVRLTLDRDGKGMNSREQAGIEEWLRVKVPDLFW